MGTDHFCLSLHRELLDLVKQCAQYGESNSVLLIGPRGSGKSLVGSFLCIIRFIPREARPKASRSGVYNFVPQRAQAG